MSIPLARISNLLGKHVVVMVGNVCLVLSSLAFFVFSNEQLGTWLAIVPYLVVFGVGRGVWVSYLHYFIID
jgi:ABC-type polysaccharide/polyol phosphate export permease